MYHKQLVYKVYNNCRLRREDARTHEIGVKPRAHNHVVGLWKWKEKWVELRGSILLVVHLRAEKVVVASSSHFLSSFASVHKFVPHRPGKYLPREVCIIFMAAHHYFSKKKRACYIVISQLTARSSSKEVINHLRKSWISISKMLRCFLRVGWYRIKSCTHQEDESLVIFN